MTSILYLSGGVLTILLLVSVSIQIPSVEAKSAKFLREFLLSYQDDLRNQVNSFRQLDNYDFGTTDRLINQLVAKKYIPVSEASQLKSFGQLISSDDSASIAQRSSALKLLGSKFTTDTTTSFPTMAITTIMQSGMDELVASSGQVSSKSNIQNRMTPMTELNAQNILQSSKSASSFSCESSKSVCSGVNGFIAAYLTLGPVCSTGALDPIEVEACRVLTGLGGALVGSYHGSEGK